MDFVTNRCLFTQLYYKVRVVPCASSGRIETEHSTLNGENCVFMMRTLLFNFNLHRNSVSGVAGGRYCGQSRAAFFVTFFFVLARKCVSFFIFTKKNSQSPLFFLVWPQGTVKSKSKAETY